MIRPILFSLAAALASPAMATDSPVLTLDAKASIELPQDLARASFFVEKEGVSASETQAQANRVLTDAARQLKAQPNLAVIGTTYQVYPVYGSKDGLTKAWRVRGTLQVESRNFALLSDVAGQLGHAVTLENVAFSLSREAREKAEASLMADAIKAFQVKADQAAKAFGKSKYQLKEVVVAADSGHAPVMPGIQPMMMAKSMGAEMASPPIEGGKALVSVSVAGKVTLD